MENKKKEDNKENEKKEEKVNQEQQYIEGEKKEEEKQEQIKTEINTDKKIDKTLENDYTTLINLQEYQKIFLELIEKFSNLREFNNKFFENIVTYMRAYIYEREDYDLIFKKIWEIIIRNPKESIIKRYVEIIQTFSNT